MAFDTYGIWGVGHGVWGVGHGAHGTWSQVFVVSLGY